MSKRRNWYERLRQLASKGSVADWDGTLAGLHEARRQHQGQFFTPDAVAWFMWRAVGLDLVTRTYPKVTIFDSSFGSARLLQFADPHLHALAGIELDAELAARVQDAVRAAGFDYALVTGSLEDFRCAGKFDFALLNPPFSLHLDSPNLENFGCGTRGRYGEHSSAVSHKYALAQAVRWCDAGAAVVPRRFVAEAAEAWWFAERLRAVYHLPGGSFESEGAAVDVSVLVWGEYRRDEAETVPEIRVADLSAPVVSLLARPSSWRGRGDTKLRPVEREEGGPATTLPVTGDKRVRVVHNGRKVLLKFGCAVAEARVRNLVLREVVYPTRERGKRLAAGVKFSGQGQLDLESYLIQPDPEAAFGKFLASIRSLGFEPEVDPGLLGHLRRRARRHGVLTAPLRHVVHVNDGGFSRWLARQEEVKVVFKKRRPDWFAIEAGTRTKLTRRGSGWVATVQQHVVSLPEEDVVAYCQFPGHRPEPNEWKAVHAGLAESHPALYAERLALARRLGLDKWCSWDYQLSDLVEVSLKRGNVLVGWEMGLGKARLAVSLCLLGRGQANLIVVEAHLLAEMVREFEVLGLPAAAWQLIDKPAKLSQLRQVNLISYSRLKSVVAPKHSKRITYSHRLRRRVHTMICDEGHLLRNPQTDQVRAVRRVSPRVRYAMSGTPVANYPRDVLPVIQWVAGDGVAHQPFGDRHPYLTSGSLQTMEGARRGVDVFRDMFVVLEWVTNEFAEDLREGAKREVPKINDVAGYRRLVAPVLKRRVLEEPEVAAQVPIPRPTVVHTDVEWDREHLIYYVRTAREFIEWFKSLSDYEKRNLGLIGILAKLWAVHQACNYPQEGVGGQAPYRPLTSKQRTAVERVREWVAEGHKVIVLCHSPAVAELLAREIGRDGTRSVIFHGGVTMAKRIEALDAEFRFGDVPVLCATKGVLQTGYNIHQANRVLFYDRSWLPKVEQQAAARVLRPQQKREVLTEYLHLRGSIDTYQAQMVHCKATAARAGLDHGADNLDGEFVHIETILGRFIQEFEKTFGVSFDKLLEQARA